MTDEELQEIVERQYSDPLWKVQYIKIGNPIGQGIIVFTTCKNAEFAKKVAYAPFDIAALLQEVQFLRGLLTDLCEESRAVAEVGRLRQIIQAIRVQVEDYQDTLKDVAPKYLGVAEALDRLHEMASVEYGNDLKEELKTLFAEARKSELEEPTWEEFRGDGR